MKKSKELFDKLNNIANSNGLTSFTNELKLEINDSKVSIAILGEFSSGKSTLVNSFLGKSILPVLEKPTSATIVEVVAGDEVKAIYQKGNEFGEIDFSDLEDYLMGDKSKEVDKVILETFENEFIHKGMKIIDTPGISSINEIHDDITFGYLPFIDASIIVLDINQGTITKSLKDFLKNKFIGFIDSKIIFVLNKSDTISELACKNVLEEVKKELLEIIEEPIIIPLSAKLALVGDIEKSNLNKLKELLERNVIKDKENLEESRHIKILSSKIDELIYLLSEKYKALGIDNTDLDIKIEESKKSLEKIESEKRNFEKSFDSFRDQLNSYMKNKSDIYATTLIEKGMNIKNNDENTINDFNLTIESLINDISNYISTQSSSFLSTKINSDFSHLSDEIKIKFENSLSGFRETINTISPIITGLILASFTGPIGTGVIEVTKNSSIIGVAKNLLGTGTKVIKKSDSFWQKIGPLIGNLVESIDIPNHILKFGAKKWVLTDVQNSLQKVLVNSIVPIISDLEIKMNKIIQEKYIIPQDNISNILNSARKEKRENSSNIFSIKEKIENDILNLKNIL
ncbi:MAG: dynamin family protein [Candidatus Sericytochromatia bacterium]